MGKSSAAPQSSTPHSLKGGDGSVPLSLKNTQRSAFVFMALNMSWQLALVVLIPVIAGVQLDKKFNTSFMTFVGLGVAFVGSALVMWRTMQTANRLPVPKLTEEQKREIQKQYEEDDADA
jgi:hypothetical protein